jgi:transposase-like protein
LTPLLGFRRIEAMTKHRSHSVAFKRQVAEEFIAGETLHALSKQHDISRQLLRIWVGEFDAGALDIGIAVPRSGARWLWPSRSAELP